MTTVTVFTAERMAEIEAQAVVGASIVDSHVIFTRHNGTTFDGGAIDVTVLGNLTLSVDNETYSRNTVSGTPQALVLDEYNPLTDTLMDFDGGDPAWGHWAAPDEFVFDVVGFYDIIAYVTLDSGADVPGRSVIKINGVSSSADREFEHVTSEDAKLQNQLTSMFEEGQSIRIEVQPSGNLDVTYAEFGIRKLNIIMEGSAEAGGSVGQTPWGGNIDAAGFSLQDVGAIESNVRTISATGSTETLDSALYSSFDMTMDANCTFTFSNPAPSGKDSTFSVILRGAFAPTWPASVIWPGGTEPAYDSPSLYVFKTVDAGTTWFGMLSGGGFS